MTQQTMGPGGHRDEQRNNGRMKLLGLASIVLTGALLAFMLSCVGTGDRSAPEQTAEDLGEMYGALVAYHTDFDPEPILIELPSLPGEPEPVEPVEPETEATEPAPVIRKLSDSDLIAPMPSAEKFGRTEDPSELTAVIEAASELLDGQELLFRPDRALLEGSVIRWYQDESLLAITWKEVMDSVVLSITEVKVADPSQLRRGLAGGEYGSGEKKLTTELAADVNAVAAISGDSYAGHFGGTTVYQGAVRRSSIGSIQSCFVDDRGDLLFTYQSAFKSVAEAQQFADENHIRFSLAYGPVLVDDGKRCEPPDYDLGLVNDIGPRAALCQMDTCHYLLVTSNAEGKYLGALNIHQFADCMVRLGCRKAYTLLSGRSASMSMNGELVNAVVDRIQRPVSDIVYFATAIE